MNFANYNLDVDNLTLFEGIDHGQVILKEQGSLESCLEAANVPNTILVIPQFSPKLYGIGFLKPDIAYDRNRRILLTDIEVIAGYGSSRTWDVFLEHVRLARTLQQIERTQRPLIISK